MTDVRRDAIEPSRWLGHEHRLRSGSLANDGRNTMDASDFARDHPRTAEAAGRPVIAERDVSAAWPSTDSRHRRRHRESNLSKAVTTPAYSEPAPTAHASRGRRRESELPARPAACVSAVDRGAGLWAQRDWGQGPTVCGRGTNLFCAWLGWSRTRVVFPTWDRTLPTVIGSLDRAMREFGGAPTCWLTDNEKTVTVDHVAGIAIRNTLIVEAGHLHRLPEVRSCPTGHRSGGWEVVVPSGHRSGSAQDAGEVEVARHRLSTPGHPMIDDAHYPPRPAGPLHREPKPTNSAEVAFLAIGDGARTWLVEAGVTGAARVKVKMADAVDGAALHGRERVDWALGHAARFGRFGEGDLAPILAAHTDGNTRRAGPDHSLQDRTRAWEGFGQ